MASTNQSAGYDNALMQRTPVLHIVCLGVHHVMKYRVGVSLHAVRSRNWCYAVYILQFGALFYSPRKQIPTDRDVKARKASLQGLEQIRQSVHAIHSGVTSGVTREVRFAQQMAIRTSLDSAVRGEDDTDRRLPEGDRQRRYSAM